MGDLPIPIEDKDYYVGEIELDFNDNPFDRARWLQDKLRDLHLNAEGEPLRAGEVERPQNETTLEAFA